MGQRKVFRFPVVMTDHAFDKVRAVDLTLAEFEELLDAGEINGERHVGVERVKELVLLLHRHVLSTSDERRREERILTVCEPGPARWSPDIPTGAGADAMRPVRRR